MLIVSTIDKVIYQLVYLEVPEVCIRNILPALAAAPAKKTKPRKKQISWSLFSISSLLLVGSEKMISMSFPMKNGTDIDTVEEMSNKPTAPENRDTTAKSKFKVKLS